jgi:dTDP-4-dehydrorhamnose 3,5-epimerase
MNIIKTELEGILVIEPRVFTDERGFFFESHSAARYAEAGLPERFVQDNHSRSAPGTIRGLHYQLRHPQAKLVRVIRGAVFDVAVDVRRGSPTFGRWVGLELSAENKRQCFIPAGFAHGFFVPTEVSEVEYKCTAYYAPDDQHGVIWNDPSIGIPWPVERPILSEQDAKYGPLTPTRKDLPLYREPRKATAGSR